MEENIADIILFHKDNYLFLNSKDYNKNLITKFLSNEDIECIVCYSAPNEKLHMTNCKNCSTSICNICVQKYVGCPTCRIKFDISII